jgi:hypothetical protein
MRPGVRGKPGSGGRLVACCQLAPESVLLYNALVTADPRRPARRYKVLGEEAAGATWRESKYG